MASFFNRIQRTKLPANNAMRIWMAREGEVTQPRTGKTMKPWLPGIGVLKLKADDDRRDAFVEWLTKSDNPFLAKVEVNRIWSHLTGRGLVDPIDDFRESNPPANANLLDALAVDFVKHGFDRRHIIKTILNSRTYQLSSRSNEFNGKDTKYASHARARRLSAEQLLDAISQITGVAEKFPGLPAGTLATQLPSPEVNKDFLRVFGKPARDTACDCERGTSADLAQALAIINGPFIAEKIEHPDNRIRKLTAEKKADPEILDELFLAAYSRLPNDAERKTGLAYLAKSKDHSQALEDLLWTIINSKEFLFQH
jgi:hypothetical protein